MPDTATTTAAPAIDDLSLLSTATRVLEQIVTDRVKRLALIPAPHAQLINESIDMVARVTAIRKSLIRLDKLSKLSPSSEFRFGVQASACPIPSQDYFSPLSADWFGVQASACPTSSPRSIQSISSISSISPQSTTSTPSTWSTSSTPDRPTLAFPHSEPQLYTPPREPQLREIRETAELPALPLSTIPDEITSIRSHLDNPTPESYERYAPEHPTELDAPKYYIVTFDSDRQVTDIRIAEPDELKPKHEYPPDHQYQIPYNPEPSPELLEKIRRLRKNRPPPD